MCFCPKYQVADIFIRKLVLCSLQDKCPATGREGRSSLQAPKDLGCVMGSVPAHNTTLAQPHMYSSQAPAMKRSYFKQGLQIDSFRQKLDQAAQPQNQQPFSLWF